MSDELKFRFEIVNIKLQTKKTGEDKKAAYTKLITDLVDKKIHSSVAENKHLILYSYYKKKTEFTEVDYLYGKLGKGFFFEKKSGQAIDIENLKSETIENDTSKIFDANITEYIFIPDAHRFCILLGSKISGHDVRKFLSEALTKVMDVEDIVRVEIENEPKAIDEVLTAKQIHKVDYIISYTNDDTLSATAGLFDKRLKRSQIGKIEIKAESDHNNFMNIQGEELLEGGIQLARSNGAIICATITTHENVKKTVKSGDTPLRMEIKSTLERFRAYMANLIMNNYRPKIEDAE